jgi:hypothetical protein
MEKLLENWNHFVNEVDKEGRMAKSQMFKVKQYAEELHDMLDDETQLPAWVQAKLTKIADYISIVKHHLEHEDYHDRLDENPCWDGYEQIGMKDKDGKEVPNCVPISEDLQAKITERFGPVEEAEYQGRKVQLNKPMQGDVKKFKVYVKDPGTGNIKKVNFGDPNMRIKKNNPERRKSFRARHNCDNPGPKTKARYWSCKKW